MILFVGGGLGETAIMGVVPFGSSPVEHKVKARPTQYLQSYVK